MKLIVALIQPNKLEDVKKALLDADITKMTVTNVVGCGQQAGYNENYRGTIKQINLLKKVKIEIAVNDKVVKNVINTIVDSAGTGKVGDGKIFVMPIDDCIRIRTKEQGNKAID